MPKLQNVTNAEIAKAMEAATDLIGDLHHITNRAEQGYVDAIEEPMARVRTLAVLAAAALGLQGVILTKAALAEQKRELETMLRARVAADKAAGA